MIIEKPLTQQQREAMSSVSDKEIRAAQDALFIYLMNKIDELEAKLPAQLKSASASKMQVYNRA